MEVIERKHLSQILHDMGMINEERLEKALSEHRRTRMTLTSILVREGFLTKNLIRYALEIEYTFNHFDHDNFVSQGEGHIAHHNEEPKEFDIIPIVKSDSDINEWSIDFAPNQSGCEASGMGPSVSGRFMVIAQDDYYNYVTETNTVCRLCDNPLIIRDWKICPKYNKSLRSNLANS